MPIEFLRPQTIEGELYDRSDTYPRPGKEGNPVTEQFHVSAGNAKFIEIRATADASAPALVQSPALPAGEAEKGE